jgi:VanZ family protein
MSREAGPAANASSELLRRWGPIALWVATISLFSTAAFSAAETGRALVPILHWLWPGISPAAVEWIHVGIRKGMHVAEFGLLAILWYRGLAWGEERWQVRLALFALILAACVGAADEFHQFFVPGRTPAVTDVGWDSLGATLGLVGRRAVRR